MSRYIGTMAHEIELPVEKLASFLLARWTAIVEKNVSKKYSPKRSPVPSAIISLADEDLPVN